MQHYELEKNLIENFKKQFYKKTGYFPVINIEKPQETPKHVFQELEGYFFNFLPKMHNRMLFLSGKERNREITELRCIFTYICRTLGYKLKEIGAFLGGRDHSTILYEYKIFNDLIHTSSDFREKYKKILNHIKNNHKKDDKLSIMVNFDPIWSES